MKRTIIFALCLVLCFAAFSITGMAKELVAVGQLVGLQLFDGTVTVASFDEKDSPAQTVGMELGDRILQIDGKNISTAQDVQSALNASKGQVTVEILRKDGRKTFQIQPIITKEGPKLGLYLRQGVTGVGTVTWYDPETSTFGTLGHGVNDASGNLLCLSKGKAYTAVVAAVRKGKCGSPGQLMGCADAAAQMGELQKNTVQGVFGTTEVGWTGQTLQTAAWEEIKTGDATILSTVEKGNVQEYSVEILKIYPQSKQTGRNLLIKVTDPELLMATGGIVQGMSGSPIIQNGKLIGAVTHVLVNDPTTGYGIFIENMLSAAG